MTRSIAICAATIRSGSKLIGTNHQPTKQTNYQTTTTLATYIHNLFSLKSSNKGLGKNMIISRYTASFCEEADY